MSRIGISITKSVLFRGVAQEFSNVYYYTNVGGLPDSSQADNLIDALTAIEKGFHSTQVTFVRGRLWSQAGSPGANNMISQKNLSGTGSKSTVANMDRERAYLFRLRAGVDSRGQPVYLRKWYHSCGFFAAISIDAGKLEITNGLTSTEKDTMRTAVQQIGQLSGSGGPWDLCAKSGRMATAGEVWQPHTYLEHHQLGDQWRAN